MILSRLPSLLPVALCALALAACGGGAAAPASSSPAAPASSAPVSKPAAAASAPAKPVASGSASASAKPAGSAAASGLTRVKLAFSQVSAAATPIYVAADQGFYQKHGLDVSIGQIAGPQQVPAMTSGEIQFGTPGGNEVADADLSGASLVMLATASNVPLFSLNAPKSTTDAQQLAGKSVAITTAGSSTEAAAKIFLTRYGLLDKVKLQPSGQMQGVLAAVEQGTAAGGILSPPSTGIANQQGFPELINGPKLGELMVHSSVGVTRDYLKSHTDVVKQMLQAYQGGLDLYWQSGQRGGRGADLGQVDQDRSERRQGKLPVHLPGVVGPEGANHRPQGHAEHPDHRQHQPRRQDRQARAVL